MISSDNFLEILKEHATLKNEILFTTLSSRTLKQTAFMIGHLRRVGMLQNTLVIAETIADCQSLASMVICRDSAVCYVHNDLWLPKNTQLGNINSNLLVFHKWFWFFKFLSAGFHTIYLDEDSIPLVNLFDSWDSTWDFQGLSDLRLPGNYPSVGEFTECHRLIYDGTGSCQSTGVMFMRSVPDQLSQIKSVVYKMMHDIQVLPQEWEQAKWQKYTIAPFKWKYRLLPKEEYGNLDDFLYFLSFTSSSASVFPLFRPRLLHLGYYFGEDKVSALQCFGLL